MTPKTRPLFLLALAAAAGAPFADCRADDEAATSLHLDMAKAYAQPEASGDAAESSSTGGTAASAPSATSGSAQEPAPRERRFGRAGSRWWSIGSGIANDFGQDTDVNLHGIYSTFLADELEFGVEVAGWYFHQEGQDTGGISGSMIFRWHFYHWGGDDGFRSTFFGDAGIGLLAAFDEVPDGGTGLDFLPRLGLGYTHALTDDEAGSRLALGLRWHHISNARIEGDARSPARDGLMLYAEIQFPF